MAERGIDITDEYPKPWTDEVVRATDVVARGRLAGSEPRYRLPPDPVQSAISSITLSVIRETISQSRTGTPNRRSRSAWRAARSRSGSRRSPRQR
jgi:hypothetical protein